MLRHLVKTIQLRPSVHCLTTCSMSTTPTRQSSPATPPDERPTKRVKLDSTPAVEGKDAIVEKTVQVNLKEPRLPYGKGLHLAPMVRIGTLPTRLLALEYGAELVWGPEIVDKAIIGSIRTVDPKTGTISFLKNNKSIFECHPIEKSRLIFQLGSADPVLAVQAAKLVEGDVAGIGLNCGCPKPFSISGGMGAALLSEPEKLCSILRALTTSLSVPIDAKIRLLSSTSSAPTLPLISSLLSTGISALTIHCRTKEMRSSEPALLHLLSSIVSFSHSHPSAGPNFPIIANGDCFDHRDSSRIKELTGVKSIMIARGAEQNVSCFLPEGLLDPFSKVLPLYVRVAKLVGNNTSNTKYVLNTAYLQNSPDPPGKKRRGEIKGALNKAKSYEEFLEVFGVKEEDEGGEVSVEEKLRNLLPNWFERAGL